MSTGFPDVPIKAEGENQFNTENYVNALFEFILECSTPMTIAIQGDWGTGKTSMMNMIEKKIKEEKEAKKIEGIECVDFNTWQYSQFNLGDQLPVLLLNKLVNALAKEDQNKAKIKGVMTRLVKLASKVAIGYISQGTVNPDENQIVEELDSVEELVNLRGIFQDIVKEKAGENGRVVIFVDDLDRLQPEKAVEILEVMKVFLDCEKCVFVLAVDSAVVMQGVKAKYGEQMSEEKGRSFFDKIIQLPFKMPVAQYSIDKYLKGLLTDIWGTVEKDEENDIKQYVQIIDNTIGKNPRSIKRTVNSFTIIYKVAESEGVFLNDSQEVKKHKQKVLFALLCIQLACEPLYMDIMDNAEELKDSLADYRDDEKFCERLNQLYPDKDIKTKDPFFIQMDSIIEIFADWCEDLLKSAKNNAENQLTQILTLSQITSSDTSSASVKTVKTPLAGKGDYLICKERNQQTDWFTEIAENYEEQKGFHLKFYVGQNPHIKLTDRLDKPVCDCYFQKDAVAIDCRVRGENAIEEFRDWLNENHRDKFSRCTPFSSNRGLSIWKIRDKEFIRQVMEYTVEHR